MATIATVTINDGSADRDYVPQFRDPVRGLAYVWHSSSNDAYNSKFYLNWSPISAKRQTERTHLHFEHPDAALDAITQKHVVLGVNQADVRVTLVKGMTDAAKTTFYNLLKNAVAHAVFGNAVQGDPPVG
jgi:hypothetical protein